MTSTALTKKEPMDMLADLARDADTFLAAAKVRKVTSAEEREKVIGMCKALRGRADQVEALKELVVKPQRDVVTALTKKFTGPLKAYEATIAALKAAIVAFDRDEEARKAAAAIEAAKEAKAGNADAAHAALMLAVAPQEKGTSGSFGTKRWTVKVTDPTKVPRQFLVVNESLLLAHAKANNGAEVPGVVFEQVSSITIR